MKSFVSNEIGRIVVIHLGKGDLLLEGIRRECERLGIQNAILLSCIGSLRRLSMHVIMNTEQEAENAFLVIEEPIEIGAVQGIILGGEPHLHMVCSAPGNKHYAGHMEDGCEVQYLAEISLMEVKDMNLTRRLDEFGIGYIDAL